MATNEQIVTGRKFRKLVDEATKLWQRISFWTKASDVEFNDTKTAETKVGAIDGITDSLVSTSSRIAASAKALNQLNNNLTTKMPGQLKLIAEGSGADVKYYAQLGADAASKKPLGSSKFTSYKSVNANSITADADYDGAFFMITFGASADSTITDCKKNNVSIADACSKIRATSLEMYIYHEQIKAGDVLSFTENANYQFIVLAKH